MGERSVLEGDERNPLVPGAAIRAAARRLLIVGVGTYELREG